MPKKSSINYAEWGRCATAQQQQQLKSYRNIYMKLNCTMLNICTMLDGACVFMWMAIFVETQAKRKTFYTLKR